MKKFFIFLLFFKIIFGAEIYSVNNSNVLFKPPKIIGESGFSAHWFFQGGFKNYNFDLDIGGYNINNDFIQNVFNYDLNCPSIKEAINKTSIPKIEKETLLKKYLKNPASAEVVLDSVDFTKGTYLCRYTFNNGASFVLLRYMNQNAFKTNQKFISKLKNDNSIDNLYKKYNLDPLIATNLGFVKIKPGIDWTYEYLSAFNSLKSYILRYKKDLEEATKGFLISLKSSIDSHTNYQNTIPAFLVGLITLSPSYINSSNAISPNGELNLKIITPSLNQFKNSNKNQLYNNIQDYLTNFQNTLSTINKKFWGFYYYLYANLNDAVSVIIRIIFALGTLGLFGYATIAKKSNFIGTEKEHAFKFDFSKKFVGLVLMFFAFTAPVIPSGNIKISDNYLYSKNPSNQTQHNYVTIIQGLIRYVWQSGNYFANYLSDYVNFAFLKYAQTSVGVNSTPEMILTAYNKSLVGVLLSDYDVVNKTQFLITYCKYSYPNIYAKYGYFPETLNNNYFSVDNGYSNGENVRKILKNAFGFKRVDYKFCSKLSSNLLNEDLAYAFKINSFYNLSENYNHYFRMANVDEIKGIEHLEKTIIAFNDKAGWLSTTLLPIEEMIFKTRNIFGIGTTLEKIGKAFVPQTIYVVNINNKQTLKNPIEINSKGEALNENNITTTQFLKEIKVNHWFENFLGALFNNNLSQTIMSAMSYGILPGFTSFLKAIYTWLIGLKEFIISLVTSLAAGGGFLGKIMGWAVSKVVPTPLLSLIIMYVSLVVAIFLYQIFLTIIILSVILLAILIKIIIYYLEMAATFILSYVVVLWGLFTDPRRVSQGISQFFIHVFKLGFIPILIVLSMVFVVIANNLIEFIYYLIFFMITKAYSTTIDDTYFRSNQESLGNAIIHQLFAHPQAIGLGNTQGIFGTLSNVFIQSGFHASSFIVILLIKLIVDLLLIIKFSDWAFEIIGYKELSSSIGGNIADVIKGKTEQRFGGNMV